MNNAMLKERLYLLNTTLRARSRAGAHPHAHLRPFKAPSTNKSKKCRRAAAKDE
jgi:hypothetical protein